MGYIEPRIPDTGFRLETPGDYRSISFVGYQSFTIHFGVCPLDPSYIGQTAQLWAWARFDTELDSLLGIDAPRRDGIPAIRVEPPTDVIPDETMLVQMWKNGYGTFGNGGKQIRLSFSYPCTGTPEGPMAEVYELDIKYEGRYHRPGGTSLRTQRTGISLSSVGKRSS